tara:strand:+ start:1781 stop:2779 length:999 start_codon:yes stop_codon:yes gene_type:complete
MLFKYALGALAVGLTAGVISPAPVIGQETHTDRIEIERESDVFMRRGDGVVTQLDFDVYLSQMPPHHRPAFVSSPDNISDALNQLMTPRQLAAEAREKAPEVVNDPLLQGQMYQAAIVQIAERYMTHIWEQERLDDYTDQAREIFLVRKDLLRQPLRADFTHVLIRSGGSRGELDAMKSIINVYDLLAEGRTVENLAAEYSEDPQAESNSGRYEDVEVSTLDPAVSEMVQQLQPGQISQPFRSEFGWHILKLNDQWRPEVESFDQVRDQALNVAEQRHKTQVRERILRRFNLKENEFEPGAVEALTSRYKASEQDLEKLKADIRKRLGQQEQ